MFTVVFQQGGLVKGQGGKVGQSLLLEVSGQLPVGQDILYAKARKRDVHYLWEKKRSDSFYRNEGCNITSCDN